jgi:hypothetical protein
LRTRTAEIALPLPTSGHAFDLLALEELPFRARGQEALVRLTLDPHEVKCFLVTPRLMRAAVQGHALRGSLPNGTVGGRLVAALIDDEGVRRQTKEIDTTGDPRQLTINLRDLFGEARGRMLLRIAGPYATADEMVVRRQ